jgi:two-component system sensor histidine kinase PrrB
VDNLLENAARHGGPQPRIDVAIDSRPRGEVIVVVDDNGPGVDPDELDHLTERFARGRRTSAPGSGLGLAVVNQQATLHGGHLSLTASHRGGLRAELHLPTALG